ncbi:MAG TPA: hypothetical protein VFP34_06490 [Microlunatus sp.]|nr:hypothetical protein [Microlunatus sp.]
MSTPSLVRAGVVAIIVGGGLVASPPVAGAAFSGGPPVCGGLIAYNRNPGIPGTLVASQILAIPAGAPTDGAPRVIWDDPAEAHAELDPAWSPDGRSIAFATVEPAGVSAEGFPLINSRLKVLRPGASEPETVIEQLGQRGGLRQPTWSPDGTRIAYLTGVPPIDKPYQGLSWVHVVDVATTSDRFLTGVELTAQRTVALTWSPRGDQLLFTAWEVNTGNWTIYSTRPDPADPQLTARVSNDPSREPRVNVALPVMYPAYLPGGSALLVEHEGADEASTGLDLTSTGFDRFLPVLIAEGFNGQADFGISPLQAVYRHGTGNNLLSPNESSIEVLTLPSGRSKTLVPPEDGVLVDQPDWQPAFGCRPWPFTT